jgi:hypothetical protein
VCGKFSLLTWGQNAAVKLAEGYKPGSWETESLDPRDGLESSSREVSRREQLAAQDACLPARRTELQRKRVSKKLLAPLKH